MYVVLECVVIGTYGGAAVLLVANGILWTAKHLPEVSRAAVRAGLPSAWLGDLCSRLIIKSHFYNKNVM